MKRSAVLLAVGLIAALAPLNMPTAAAQAVEDCRLASNDGEFYAGFPLTPNRIDSTGTVRAAALFVDFSDAPNSETTTTTLARRWSSDSEAYLEAASYGALDFELVPHNSWLRLPQTSDFYQNNPTTILGDAIAAADPQVDFTGIDTFFVLPEPTSDFASGVTTFGEFLTENGSVSLTGGNVFATHFGQGVMVDLDADETFMLKSAMLLMGLRPTTGDGATFAERRRYTGNFGFMGQTSGYAGGTLSGMRSTRNGNELLAWNRWQLGWTNDTQTDCLSGNLLRSTLTSVAVPGGTKLAAARLDATRVLAVEARTQAGYDRDIERDGVLVYIADGQVSVPNAAFQVQGDYTGDFPNGSVLLQPGDTLSVEGYDVRVTAKAGARYDIEIAVSGQLRCNGNLVTIDMNTNGGDGQGTEGPDVIMGTPAADTINAGGGDDIICGDGGNDIILGEAGDDHIFGQDGDDKIWGAQGADTIDGGPGHDTLHGNRGNDTLDGGDGNDKIFGYAHNDLIRGGNGDDRLHGNFGDDIMSGDQGDDRMFGYGDNDQMSGGGGNDLLGGNFGDDILNGDVGDDTLYGSDGADIVRGGFDNDLVQGNSGDDIVEGGPGDDELDGGINVDTCNGDSGTDTATRCETVTGVP